MEDTFRALTHAAHSGEPLPQGKELAAILTDLVAVESAPGGPYFSEFSREGNTKGKITAGANRAIAEFLALYDIELPALARYVSSAPRKSMPNQKTKKLLHTEEEKMMALIRRAWKKRCAAFPAEIGKRAEHIMERTITGNPDMQMSLMALYMHQALGSKKNTSASVLLADMGLANIFFWSAFIVYDDFWDEDEAADPKHLPIANLFARHYTDFFSHILPEKTGFRKFFHELMDKLDAANAWETAHCRMKIKDGVAHVPEKLPEYGDYEKKFAPASGHIFGPLALLVKKGYSLRGTEAKNLIDYFRHYLISMQINDDAHDWEEDLRRGHISTVVDMLLRDYGKKEIHIDRDLSALQQTFWWKTIKKSAEKALVHTQKSRRALGRMKSIQNPAPLLRYIENCEKVANEALTEQKNSEEFLQSWNK